MSRGAVSVDRELLTASWATWSPRCAGAARWSSDSSKPTSNARMVGLTCVAEALGSACHVVDVARAGAKKSISSWLTRSASSWWTQCEASGRRSTRSRLGTSSSWGSASLDVVLHLLGRDVVLDEAVLAARAGEVEVLAVIELGDGADDGADGVGPTGAVEHRPLQGDVAGQRVDSRRVVARETAGRIAPAEVRRNTVGCLGPGDVGHGVRVVHGEARRARDRPGVDPGVSGLGPQPHRMGPARNAAAMRTASGPSCPHWSADICGYARFAVVDTPVKAATNSPGAAAACWRSHVAIAGSDEDGSRPMAGLEDLDVRGVVDARQRGPVRARRVVRSGRPAGGFLAGQPARAGPSKVVVLQEPHHTLAVERLAAPRQLVSAAGRASGRAVKAPWRLDPKPPSKGHPTALHTHPPGRLKAEQLSETATDPPIGGSLAVSRWGVCRSSVVEEAGAPLEECSATCNPASARGAALQVLPVAKRREGGGQFRKRSTGLLYRRAWSFSRPAPGQSGSRRSSWRRRSGSWWR